MSGLARDLVQRSQVPCAGMEPAAVMLAIASLIDASQVRWTMGRFVRSRGGWDALIRQAFVIDATDASQGLAWCV